MFHEMDTDGNGPLSYKEFISASVTPAVITKLKALEIEKNELDELWDLLDDGHDAVTIDEFCEGLRKVQSEVKAKEIMECIRKMRQLHTRTNKQRKRCKLAIQEHLGSRQALRALVCVGAAHEVRGQTYVTR